MNTRWLVFVAVAVIVVLGLLWVFQRRLIYLPTHAVADPSRELPTAEPVSLSTDDGLTLGAWFVLPEDPSKGTVIVFNGNAGNRSHRIPLAQALTRHGYGVLLLDYRGYGANPGTPTESGLAADARAAHAFVESRHDVDPTRLAYFGESLGGAVALGLAVEHPPAALVLRSPFTSLADIGSVHYPFIPISLLLRDEYRNLELIGDVTAPVLVIAGTADRIVPAEQSTRLYEAASEPKRLVLIEGANHNDLALLAGQEMIEEIDRFLGAHLGE